MVRVVCCLCVRVGVCVVCAVCACMCMCVQMCVYSMHVVCTHMYCVRLHVLYACVCDVCVDRCDASVRMCAHFHTES